MYIVSTLLFLLEEVDWVFLPKEVQRKTMSSSEKLSLDAQLNIRNDIGIQMLNNCSSLLPFLSAI